MKKKLMLPIDRERLKKRSTELEIIHGNIIRMISYDTDRKEDTTGLGRIAVELEDEIQRIQMDLENRDEIRVGDRVRSYDFPERRDCYVEGKVAAIKEHHGCQQYLIQADKSVWRGEQVTFTNEWVYAPVNGTPTTMGRTTNGVEKLEGA